MLTLVQGDRHFVFDPQRTEEIRDFLRTCPGSLLVWLETEGDWDEVHVRISEEQLPQLAILDQILNDGADVPAVAALLKAEGLTPVPNFSAAYLTRRKASSFRAGI